MRPVTLLLLLMLPASAAAQLAISIRAGLIQHIQGRAFVDERPVNTDSYHFRQLNEGQCLRTERGRAEVVLAPGRVLRLDRQSEFELVSDDITDVKIELLRGSAFVDWDERFSDGVITVLAGDASVRITERGLYRIDRPEDGPSDLKVYGGKAVVETLNRERSVRSGRVLELIASGSSPERFDRDKRDYFDRWNRRRSQVVGRMTAPPGSKRIHRRLGPPLGADGPGPELGGFGGFGPLH